MSLIDKIFGSYSKKELARIEPIKQAVLDLDEEYSKLSEQTMKMEEYSCNYEYYLKREKIKK